VEGNDGVLVDLHGRVLRWGGEFAGPQPLAQWQKGGFCLFACLSNVIVTEDHARMMKRSKNGPGALLAKLSIVDHP
jgi:hypothetical protein